MPTSLSDPLVADVLNAQPATTTTSSGANISYPFPSPADWRDHWIYFLLVDRFNNPSGPPAPNEYPCAVYQGGNFSGIRQQLPYLKKMGVGALWLSPVLINPQWFTNYWGGYGTLDFLRIEPRFCEMVPNRGSMAPVTGASMPGRPCGDWQMLLMNRTTCINSLLN